MAKVFVHTTLKLKDKVSVAASHELVKMLVDPATNLCSTGPKKNCLYDYEVADPVEELTFNVNGIPMTNFVYPQYFEAFHKSGTIRIDHMGKLKPALRDSQGRLPELSGCTGRTKPSGVVSPRSDASCEKTGAATAAPSATKRNENCRRRSLARLVDSSQVL